MAVSPETEMHLARIESLREQVLGDENTFVRVFSSTYSTEEDEQMLNSYTRESNFFKTLHARNAQLLELFLYDAVVGDHDVEVGPNRDEDTIQSGEELYSALGNVAIEPMDMQVA